VPLRVLRLPRLRIAACGSAPFAAAPSSVTGSPFGLPLRTGYYRVRIGCYAPFACAQFAVRGHADTRAVRA